MTLEELDSLQSGVAYEDPSIVKQCGIELGDYVYQLRDVAASALNLLEKLEPKDLFLAARVEETIKRLREELGE